MPAPVPWLLPGDPPPVSLADQADAWRRGSIAPLTHAEAETAARQLALGHYENFPVVSWALPRDLRQPFYNVYAFCRWADDLGDDAGTPERARELLDWWQHELEACYAGEPRHWVFTALLPTIRRFDIPMTPFADLISAFQQDQLVTDYETFPQLQDYCRRSADPVGRIVLHLCERVTDENVRWSDSICTGLQLANFWQDVARDLDIGRIYLPREDRARFAYSDDDLRQRRTTPAFLDLMRFEVDRARGFLTEGLPLVDRMPGRLKIDIDLFIQGGLQILREIERIDYRVWETRPKVTKGMALRLLAKSAWKHWGGLRR